MEKCCSLHQKSRPQRRINGLQLPLNYQQVLCWIVLIITALLNFGVLTQIQFDELETISLVLFIGFYVAHCISHLTAILLDPSETELQKLKIDTVPEFDRNIHAHVIENGRCHLCNIHTSSRKTKHCSICNKCVDRFDHHCKWLNTCVGHRNYAAFIVCVITALLLAVITSSLCVTDIVLFFIYPQQLSNITQNFINCNATEYTTYDSNYCTNSIIFLVFLVIFLLTALGIACALIHLCCFHVYISLLGISTYEYIVTSGTSELPYCTDVNNWRCCGKKISKRIYKISKKSKVKTTNVDMSDFGIDSEINYNNGNNETNVSSFIGILINNELNRAKKIFVYHKNKIHPEENK